MSGFDITSGHLDIEDASGLDDGQWRLKSPLVYHSDIARGTIAVPAGFVTDLASVPRLPFIFCLFGGTSSKAAVIHDYLYRYKPLPRRTAGAVLKEASAATGVARWRRWAMWAGVRLAGWRAWDEDQASPVTPTS
ncbi:DUF1353 domain-containing protein [Robbsia andropogonis]|uniref:DUF1353 domain-containing protein n=1 Tax=Robbsia andropogonis TaxID=28092 RepID=UPI003D2636DC